MIQSINIGEYGYNRLFWKLYSQYNYKEDKIKKLAVNFIEYAQNINTMLQFNKKEFSFIFKGKNTNLFDIANLISLLDNDYITDYTIACNGTNERDWFIDIKQSTDKPVTFLIELFTEQQISLDYAKQLVDKLSDFRPRVSIHFTDTNHEQCKIVYEYLFNTKLKPFYCTSGECKIVPEWYSKTDNLIISPEQELSYDDCIFTDMFCTSTSFNIEPNGVLYNTLCDYRKQYPLGDISKNPYIHLIPYHDLCKCTTQCKLPSNTRIYRPYV